MTNKHDDAFWDYGHQLDASIPIFDMVEKLARNFGGNPVSELRVSRPVYDTLYVEVSRVASNTPYYCLELFTRFGKIRIICAD
jgi:hypothetical protein